MPSASERASTPPSPIHPAAAQPLEPESPGERAACVGAAVDEPRRDELERDERAPVQGAAAVRDRCGSASGPRASRGRVTGSARRPSRSSRGGRRGPGPPRTGAASRGGCPGRRSRAGGATAATSDARERSANPSRQPCTREICSDGRPSTVTPLIPSAFPGAGAKPQDGDGVGASGESGVPLERRRVEHGNERLQVLADDEVERDGERGLIALGADERGAVALGEQRQREGEREERDGHGSRAGAAAERHGGEAGADAAVDDAAGQAHERAEQPRRRNGGGERDQAGQQEQHEARSARPRRAAPRRRRHRRARRRRPREPRRRRRRAGRDGSLPGPGTRWRRRSTTVATTTTPAASASPGRGEHALAQDGADRRPGPCGRRALRPAARSSQPVTVPTTATVALSAHGQQPQVPASRPVPGETAAGRLEIAPHAPRGEHREGEQQRGRLAADEQEPPARDRGSALGGAQLLDRGLHAVSDRADRERRPRPLALAARGRRSARASVCRPRAATPRRSSGRCWRRPAARVSASIPSATTSGAGGGRWYPAACCSAGATSRSARALSVGARKSPKSRLDRSVAVPTSHEPQPRCVREPAAAPQAHDLAALRRAAAGQPSARQPDVRREAVDAGEGDEAPGDGALPEQDDPRRAREPDDRRASSRPWRRAPDRPARRRRARRTTRRGPSARPRGCARPPARRSGPARSSCRRERRRARPSRRRSRWPRAGRPRSAVVHAATRARRRRAPPSARCDARRRRAGRQTLPRTPWTGRPAASHA